MIWYIIMFEWYNNKPLNTTGSISPFPKYPQGEYRYITAWTFNNLNTIFFRFSLPRNMLSNILSSWEKEIEKEKDKLSRQVDNTYVETCIDVVWSKATYPTWNGSLKKRKFSYVLKIYWKLVPLLIRGNWVYTVHIHTFHIK